MRMQDKVIWITGGAGGIGKATANALIAQGAKVVISDLDEKAGSEIARELGDSCRFEALDVTDASRWRDIATRVQQEWGGIDALVNNAGRVCFKSLLEHSSEDLMGLMNINVNGAMLGMQAVAPLMRDRGGAIVNVSSSEGLTATNGLAAYIASKWALRGLTKAAAMELGHWGIRVNSVHPGGVNTPMGNPAGLDEAAFDEPYKRFPAQRGAAPKDIADVIVFLCSDESRHCMGAEIAVDGGMTIGHYNHFLPGAPETV